MHVEHPLINDTLPNNIGIEPPIGRILVILIDSLQKDSAFSDQMPFLSNYRKRGAWGTSEVISTPLSIAGDRAIFAGITSSPFALLDDFNPGTASHDNLFSRLSHQGKKVALFGSLIDSAYGAHTFPRVYQPRAFRLGEYEKELRDVYQQAHAFLKDNHWNFAVVQFLGLDYVGHLETPNSKNYRRALSLLDEYIEKLIGITTAEDIVLITSEHGIDNKGFHADRNPLVTQTPFVFVGKPIQEGGPKRIIQIDLAPTLSVLSGISPFYHNLSLPALDLIKEADEKYAAILKEYSRLYTGNDNLSKLEDIRHERKLKMTKQPSLLLVFVTIALTLVTAICFAYVALYTVERKLSFTESTFIVVMVLTIVAIAGVVSYFDVLNKISKKLPFSANFFMENTVLTLSIFTFLAVIAKLVFFIVKKNRIFMERGPLLFSFALVFSLVFIADNPYHLINWIIFTIPLVGFAISSEHRLAWTFSLASLWVGLVIRRLTFYNAYENIGMPDRWLLCSVMFFFAATFFIYRHRFKSINIEEFIPVIISFVSAIIVIFYPIAPEWRTLFLIFLFMVLVIIIKDQKNREIWFALWVAIFYLGTSSRIENTTHMAAFPLLLAAWSASREASSIAKGIIISFVFWSLYLIPGNAFDLKLQDVSDSYLIGSALEVKIKTTVLVIISRYVLPVAILIWGVTYRDSWLSQLSTLATAYLPVLLGMGAAFLFIMLSSTIGIPWEDFSRLIVLSCFFIVLTLAFLLASSIQILSVTSQKLLKINT